jgi:hypothetical protein
LFNILFSKKFEASFKPKIALKIVSFVLKIDYFPHSKTSGAHPLSCFAGGSGGGGFVLGAYKSCLSQSTRTKHRCSNRSSSCR